MVSGARLVLSLHLLFVVPNLLTQATYYQQQNGFIHTNQMAPLSQPVQVLSTIQGSQMPPNQLNQNIHQQHQHQDQAQMSNTQEPTQPIFRFVGDVDNTSVKLVWNVLKGYPVDHFDIFWGPVPSTHEFSAKKLDGSARNYTVHQLIPDTVYQFEIVGHHGEHIFKKLLLLQTQQARSHLDTKDMTPLGVKAEPKPNNSIQLTWTEPERPIYLKNAIKVNIIRYYINPSQQTTPSLSNESTAPTSPQYHYLNTTNPQNTRLIVQKLKPGTEYAFAIKSVYHLADKRSFQSGFSMDVVARTHDIEPSAPRNFSVKPMAQPPEELILGQSGKLELTWLAPEWINGQLFGYVILYAHEPNAPEDQWNKIDVNGSNINNWYVSNLRPGWSYYFKIRAINQRGQSPDSEVRIFTTPAPSPADRMVNTPIPVSNLVMLVIICMMFVVFVLGLIVNRLCRNKRRPRKGSLNGANQKKLVTNGSLTGLNTSQGAPKLNGFTATNSSSSVTGRVGTLARRRENETKPNFWISAMDHQQSDAKSNISDKSNGELNMAMVSIQRDSPQFATTQLAPSLPDYRFASNQNTTDHLLQQLQQHHQPQAHGHYHPGHFTGTLGYDQMDKATASALMTLSKHQQQQLQKYQIQFAPTGGQSGTMGPGPLGQPTAQAPSPHQQPPPPPPLNIEQPQQSLYGTHTSTRSLRLHRPTLYDPVSGSFVQGVDNGPPNYNSHNTHHLHLPSMVNSQFNSASNTLQFHPHQTSTLMSRRSTNTLRSFQTSAGPTYGQLGISQNNQFGPPVSSIGTSQTQQQPQQLLQSHQAVINQLNNSTYPSLPLKHVSAVRPQIMSNLEDQIELELAEKEQQEQQQNQQPPIKQ